MEISHDGFDKHVLCKLKFPVFTCDDHWFVDLLICGGMGEGSHCEMWWC